jgi:murein DD-endopeptidase MepM/ murein hydrolase activator NlpD
MHKGVDFAAPRGTPIYAAGDGVVEFAGRKGAYGNYISIRHNKTIKTAYAHMHKFAKGMNAGQKVAQGEIIGYVGTTGRSTGPHLHFELLKNNVQVNPSSLNMPDTNMLAGKDLRNFKKMLSEFKDEYASATSGVKFARNYAVR